MSVSDGKLELQIVLKTNKELERELQELETRGTKAGRTIGRELAAGANEGSAAFERFQRTVQRNEQQIRNIGLSAAAVGVVITGAVTLSVNEWLKFEESIARATGAAGGNRDMMRELMDVARSVSLEYARAGVTAKNAADVLFFLTSAGLNAADSQRVLRDVVKLAAGTQSDFEQMARLVIQTTKGFNLEMSESSRVVQFLAAMNQAGTIEMGELGAAMRQVASVAGGLKVGLEETGAALLIIRDSGRTAEQAGTDLRNIMLRLLNPTSEGKEILRQLGLTATQVSPQLHTLSATIDLLRSRNMTAKQASELFTTEALAGYMALANRGGAAMSDLQQKITGTRAADQQLALQTEITKGTFNEARVVMTHLSEEIGELASKRIEPATQRTVEWLRVLKELPGPLKQISVDVALITGGLLSVVGVGTGVLLFWAKFGAAIATAAGVVAAFILRAAPWIAAITAVALALGELERRTGALSTAWERLTGIADKVFALFQSKATDELGQRLKDLNFEIYQMERGGKGFGSWWNPEEHKKRLDGLKAEREAIQWILANRGNAVTQQRAGERQDFSKPVTAPATAAARGPVQPEPPDPKETEAFRDLARMADKAVPESALDAIAQPIRAAIEKMKLPPEVEKSWLAWADSVAVSTLMLKNHEKAMAAEIKQWEALDLEVQKGGDAWANHLEVEQRAIDEMAEHEARMAGLAVALASVSVGTRALIQAQGTANDQIRETERSLRGEEEALKLTGAAANAARLSWSLYGRTLDDLSDDEREGIRLLAEKTQKLNEQTVALERARQANELYAKLSIAGLQDLTTATKIQAALELEDRQRLTQQVLDMRQRVADKDHTAHVNALREQQIRMQEEGNVLGFFTASLASAAVTAGSFWSGMQGLAASTAQAMQRSLSDVFFRVFTGEAITAAEIFRAFMQSMLRAIADFLSQELVRRFLSFLVGSGGAKGFAAGGIAGVGSLGGGGTDVIRALLSPGESILSADVTKKALAGDFSGVAETFASFGGKTADFFGFGAEGTSGLAKLKEFFANPSGAFSSSSAMTNFNLAGGGAAGVEAGLFGMNASQLDTAIAGVQGAEFATANLMGAESAGLLSSGGLTTTSGAGVASLAGLAAVAGLALTLATTESGSPQQAAGIAAAASTLIALGAGLTSVAASGVGLLVAAPLILGALFGKKDTGWDRPEEVNANITGQLLAQMTDRVLDTRSTSGLLGMLGDPMSTMRTMSAWGKDPAQFAGQMAFSGTSLADLLAGKLSIEVPTPLGTRALDELTARIITEQVRMVHAVETGDRLAAVAASARLHEAIPMRTVDEGGQQAPVFGAANFHAPVFENDFWVDPIQRFQDAAPVYDWTQNGTVSSFDRGGIARLHDGEIVAPRPFAQEFPGLFEDLRAFRMAMQAGGDFGDGPELKLRISFEIDHDGVTETVVRGINVRAENGGRPLRAEAIQVDMVKA